MLIWKEKQKKKKSPFDVKNKTIRFAALMGECQETAV